MCKNVFFTRSLPACKPETTHYAAMTWARTTQHLLQTLKDSAYRVRASNSGLKAQVVLSSKIRLPSTVAIGPRLSSANEVHARVPTKTRVPRSKEEEKHTHTHGQGTLYWAVSAGCAVVARGWVPFGPFTPFIPLAPFVPLVPVATELTVGVPPQVVTKLILHKGQPWVQRVRPQPTRFIKPSLRLQVGLRRGLALIFWALAWRLCFWQWFFVLGGRVGSELVLTVGKLAVFTIPAPP